MSPHDLTGTPVDEAEVAGDLGFADVHEFRRWQTELGGKVADLEHKLRSAINERDNYRWHGRRMQVVLEKIRESLITPGRPLHSDPLPSDLVLAIGVVLGKEVDWENRLKDWFPCSSS